ncbi:MAG: F0F1 ATP synthase subunit A [Candidatus Melainabacteria bacterium]|jgi:F-type H+-transporting ATPase subunit a|nr:F0F1 ATP synthase subunit A [Candidatus Melainabacteria bacterium]
MSENHFWETQLLGLPIHANTLIMVGAAMGVLLLGATWLTASMKLVPSRRQMIAESIYGVCRGITYATAEARGDKFLHYIGSLFLFILTCNLMGQLPLRLIQLPQGELMAATGDFNVPAALALCTLVMYFSFGIKQKGLSYFSHYLSPLPMMIKGQPLVGQIAFITFFWPFIFLNILEDFTRPGSLMIRLFFNILVGEILSGIAMTVAPLGLPIVVILLELLVAFIQAYVFAILSSVYISLMSENHDDHDEDHGHSASSHHEATLALANQTASV